MLVAKSYTGMQSSLNRLAAVQEQLTTGKIINRPSDDPTGASTAMRLRTALANQNQYARSAADAVGWLDQADATLASVTTQVTRARDLALQGSSGAASDQSRTALAAEVDQLRASLINAGNTQYLDRPIFGGVTAGSAAYNADGTLADPATIGTGTGAMRTVAAGTRIRVDLEGPEVFGSDGDSLFDHLASLSDALKTNDATAMSQAISDLNADANRVINARSEVGARTTRVETAQSISANAKLSITDSLSAVEDTDLAAATVNLQLQQVAYQAALGATSKVIQPSLLDFMK
jgi:flagellar hook-associated protein 3 FlgL